MTPHLREIIKNHRGCIGFPSCLLDATRPHVRLSDEERATLRQMLEGSEPRTRSAPSHRQSSVARHAQPRSSAQPSQPTAEQWKAIRVVLERAAAAGRKFPPIQIVWDGDDTLDRDTNAQTAVRRDGTVTITLRCSQSCDALRRTFAHELGHGWDAPIIQRLAPHVVEARAVEFAELYGW